MVATPKNITREYRCIRFNRLDSPQTYVNGVLGEDAEIGAIGVRNILRSIRPIGEYMAPSDVAESDDRRGVFRDTFRRSRYNKRARFSNGTFEVCYLSFDETTAMREVEYHGTNELRRLIASDPANKSELPQEVRYDGVWAEVSGVFFDLRETQAHRECLDEDPNVSYSNGQRLAKQKRDEGYDGIIYPSARQFGGVCIVMFNADLVLYDGAGPRLTQIWHPCGEVHSSME